MVWYGRGRALLYGTFNLGIKKVNTVVFRKKGVLRLAHCNDCILFGEVIGFSLFRATVLAFAIRPKDGIAKQGRRGGFHC